MTSKRELETMLTHFKVTDLQSLLSFAGQNNKGRKNDLQRKVLSLIRNNMSIPLEMRIRTMYRAMLNETQKSQEYSYQNNYDKYKNYYSNNTNTSASQPVGGGPFDGYYTKNYYQNHNSGNSYYDECMRKNNHLYTPINNLNQSNNNYQPSSPSILFDYMPFLEQGTLIPEAKNLKDAQFKKLSFYRYDRIVVPLMPMKPQHKFSDVFDYTHSFTISDSVRNFLTWPKKDEKESHFQLQLRICVLDQDTLSNLSKVADSLPLALTVKVNEKNCQLPPAIPSTNKQGMLLKRMNAPINITSHCSKKGQPNTLAINWSTECNKLYGLTVHLVEKYTSDELIERLTKTKQRSSEITRKRIQDQLDDDDDIAATSLKVSLICPLGKILMSLPARATTCNHIQCFDATLYIKMNEVKSVWQCPVCNSNCFYEDLFIDGYFVDILKTGKFSSNVCEVQINDDGSWEPVIAKKRRNSNATASPPKKKRCVSEREPDENVKINLVNSLSEEISKETSYNYSSSTLTEMPTESDNSSTSEDSAYCTPPNVSPLDTHHEEENERLENIGESSNTTETNVPSKMNVVLVDLTSDSESEDFTSSFLPLNLKKIEPRDLPKDETISSTSIPPPVYDIDDSDEHS